jgi:anti-anti-sigma regulatory factor
MARNTSVARKASAPRRLALPDSLDTSAAAALREMLLEARGQALTIEAGAVRRLGGRCAQVLLSAASSWRVDGQPLALADPSPEFAEALRLMGLGVESLTSEATAP